jgi:hypothetical protein
VKSTGSAGNTNNNNNNNNSSLRGAVGHSSVHPPGGGGAGRISRYQRAARLKKLVYGTFSAIPILRQIEITHNNYWILSSALVRTIFNFFVVLLLCISSIELMCVVPMQIVLFFCDYFCIARD